MKFESGELWDDPVVEFDPSESVRLYRIKFKRGELLEFIWCKELIIELHDLRCVSRWRFGMHICTPRFCLCPTRHGGISDYHGRRVASLSQKRSKIIFSPLTLFFRNHKQLWALFFQFSPVPSIKIS